MKVWVVMDGDYDGDWVVAVYDSMGLAEQHAKAFNLTFDEWEVLTEIAPVVHDPVTLQRVRDEAHQAIQERERYREFWETHARQVEAARIENYGKPQICRCLVYTKPEWTAHGYCSYCGGWSPEVLYKHCGYVALHEAIDRLDSNHYRERMREIVAAMNLCDWPDEVEK